MAGQRSGALQSLPGTFELEGETLCFAPRFPFVDGVTYAVVIDQRDIWTIDRPSKNGEHGQNAVPVTRVVAIYPNAPSVPVNLLKVYIHFSNPMSEGAALRAVRICRAADGERLRDVFLEMTPELWDRERTRLTLLLDPGRIKRGLLPHVEAGYPLVEGQPIAVTVDATFRDAAGLPLQESATRQYEVGPAVRDRVDHARWRYEYPRAGSIEPLAVAFDRPLDHALLEHSLRVKDDAGAPLAGRATVDPGERSWRFEPQSPWGCGRYVLAVAARLEDLAGNSLMRVFDRDLSRSEDEPRDASRIEVAFTCRA